MSIADAMRLCEERLGQTPPWRGASDAGEECVKVRFVAILLATFVHRQIVMFSLRSFYRRIC
jgi:hypothetical protein